MSALNLYGETRFAASTAHRSANHRFLRGLAPLLVLVVMGITAVTGARARKGPHGFEGVWKIIKGQSGAAQYETQTITIKRHGNTYDGYATPGFRGVGHGAIPHLTLTLQKGGVLEYVYTPASGVSRYYDLKLSTDNAMLITSHHSKFGVFGGAKYARSN